MAVLYSTVQHYPGRQGRQHWTHLAKGKGKGSTGVLLPQLQAPQGMNDVAMTEMGAIDGRLVTFWVRDWATESAHSHLGELCREKLELDVDGRVGVHLPSEISDGPRKKGTTIGTIGWMHARCNNGNEGGGESVP